MRDLYKLIPRVLKIPFWNDFLTSIAEELDDYKTEIEAQLALNILNEASEEQLVELANGMGYDPDRTLNGTIDYLRREVGSIPFRIKKKTTYTAYDHIFRFIPHSGQVFIGYWTTEDLYRAFSNTLIVNIETHDVRTPYELLPEPDFNQFIESFIELDGGYSLDQTAPSWTLDFNLSKIATKHLYAEYTVDELHTENAVEYSILYTYLAFLLNAVNKTRRVVEVPHVGCQITALCDSSGYYDNDYPAFNAYTIDAIKLRSAVIAANWSVDPFPTRMAVGIGAFGLPSAHTGGSVPAALDDQIAIRDIHPVHGIFDQGANWRLIQGEFRGNTLLERVMEVGDGIEDTFGGTFEHFPIVPGSVQIQYVSTPNTYTVTDSQKDGLLIGTRSVGTVNYETGEWTLITLKDIQVEDEIVAVGSQSAITNHFLIFQNIVPGSFRLTYRISSTIYTAQDDSVGGITGPGITAGTINYTTGEIDVTFSPTATDGGQNITADYQYTASSIPDNLSEIVALSYSVTKNINITEAGVFNAAGDMIAYSTFPPVQLGSRDFHLSMQFFIKNIAF